MQGQVPRREQAGALDDHVGALAPQQTLDGGRSAAIKLREANPRRAAGGQQRGERRPLSRVASGQEQLVHLDATGQTGGNPLPEIPQADDENRTAHLFLPCPAAVVAAGYLLTNSGLRSNL
jgi:hypothetical protein